MSFFDEVDALLEPDALLSRRWTSSSPRSAASPPEASTRSGGAASARPRRRHGRDRLGRARAHAACDLRCRHRRQRQPRARRCGGGEERGVRPAPLGGRCRRRPRRCHAAATGTSRPPSSTLSRVWRARPPLFSAGRGRTRPCGRRSSANGHCGDRPPRSLRARPRDRPPGRGRGNRQGDRRHPVPSGLASSASRCRFSPNGTPGRRVRWRYGRAPAGAQPGRPRRRTVAVDDIETSRSSRIPRLGDLQALLDLDVRRRSRRRSSSSTE